ncbi:MAG: trigger factor [Candidatus Kapabacteria bacterium]|nr:trigger factor [Ignavibacteriota bacterium]MCW5884277.1 trigger factor [Candidatus Kapabacteria bacterium]
MSRNIVNITDTEQKVTFTIPKSEMDIAVQNAIKEIIPKMNMPGFRPGKVPFNMVKKMYGKSIEHDEQNKIADAKFKEFLEEVKPNIVSQPILSEIENKGDDLEFSVEFQLIPEFELNDYKNISVDEPVHAVTDDEVQDYINRMAMINGSTEIVDTVTDINHNVYVTSPEEYSKFKENPEVGSDNIPNDKLALFDKNYHPELKEKFIGKKVEDSIEWKNPAAPADSEPIIFVITKIEKITPAELNDEKVAELTKGQHSSFEDFKTALELDLQKAWDDKSKNILEDNIINFLINSNDIKIPDVFILERAQAIFEETKKQRKLTINFEDLPESEKADLRKYAAKSVKFALIRDKIIQKEEIEVEEQDIDNYIQIAFQNMPSYDEAMLDQFRQIIRENNQIINSILGDKVMDLLKDFTTTNEVPFEEKELVDTDLFDENEDEDFDIFDEDEEFVDEDEFDEIEEWDEEDDEWDEDEDEDEDFDDDEASKKE